MKFPTMKNLRKKKHKPEWLRRARPEVVLVNSTEEVSYAAILKVPKKRVQSDELGLTVQGIRQMRSMDLLVELKCFKEGRGRLDTTLKPSIEDEDVEAAVRGFFDHGTELELKVSLTKRPYRGNRKAYVLLDKARAMKLYPRHPHQNRVGLLQTPPIAGGKSVLSLSWLWLHGGELLGAQPKQKLLEVRRRGARCGVQHKETAVLPLLR